MVLLGDGQRKESWLDSARRWLFRLLKSLSSLSEAGLTGTDGGKCSAEIFQQCPNAEGHLRGRQSKEGLQLRLPFGHSLLVGMNVRRGGPPLRPCVRPSVCRQLASKCYKLRFRRHRPQSFPHFSFSVHDAVEK